MKINGANQPDPDPEALDPGIRQTVLWLRKIGFATTDSGDGVTKGDRGLEFPHIAIRCESGSLIEDAWRLQGVLQDLGVDFDESTEDPETGQSFRTVSIEATYWPLDGVAIVMLTGFDDRMLAAKGRPL